MLFELQHVDAVWNKALGAVWNEALGAVSNEALNAANAFKKKENLSMETKKKSFYFK